MNRRQFLIAGVTTAAAIAWLKPSNNGVPYSPYFNTLNNNLKNSSNYLPSMLIDLDILDENIATLKTELNSNVDFRIVAKSLPSPDLLGYIMNESGTNKLMVFHQPFLTQIANDYPMSDVLMGKPMPVKLAEVFYQKHKKSTQNADEIFDPSSQLQWLIDTQERLQQYLTLAQQHQLKLQVNIEIDVGLHRGGIKTSKELTQLLTLIENNPDYLTFTGFMGYDPHVVKLPSFIKSPEQAFEESQAIYQGFVDTLYSLYPKYKQEKLCFNGAGSPTIALHKNKTIANELSAGSCLVKPLDFDIPSLAKFKPAAFIATPILKKMAGTTLPAAEFATNIFSLWDINMQQTFFVYGGKWLAKYESPKGLQGNGLYGTSNNQEIVNGSNFVNLNVNDFIFLRPTQSEFVFLQFGHLLPMKKQSFKSAWPILKQS